MTNLTVFLSEHATSLVGGGVVATVIWALGSSFVPKDRQMLRLIWRSARPAPQLNVLQGRDRPDRLRGF